MDRKSNRKNLPWLLTGAALAAALGGALPAQADPPPWAPAHGYRAKQQAREYKYVYYPAQQVYFAPASNTWFWASGGNWQVGIDLPTRIRVNVSSGVPVVLHSERPYVEHVYVEEHVGRPWREKHKHKHKHDRDDDDDRHEHGRKHRHDD